MAGDAPALQTVQNNGVSALGTRGNSALINSGATLRGLSRAFSANGALITCSLGQRPRNVGAHKHLRALKAR